LFKCEAVASEEVKGTRDGGSIVEEWRE
jgi:hypothetical protein